MRHEIISLKDLKGLYLLRRRFKKWRQNEWKNHVVYVYGPFDRVWAEKHPLRFSWIKEYMFIYLQTDYEMHWILRIFYRFFWILIFNTCSYGELFTGVSPTAAHKIQFVILWRSMKIHCAKISSYFLGWSTWIQPTIFAIVTPSPIENVLCESLMCSVRTKLAIRF